MLKTLNRFSKLKKNDWLIISSLLLLSLIPIMAGIVRMNDLIVGSVNSENIRFHAKPLPIAIHIVAVTIYSLLGTVQFSKGFRTYFLKLHRQFGKLLIVSGSLVAMTGLWMALFYPAINYDETFVQIVRIIVGVTMLAFLVLGIQSIQKRKFKEHGAWMIRAYALAMGAGTQVLTHIPWLLFPSIHGALARAVFMTLGWVINITVAEIIIQKNNNQIIKENI